MGILGRSWTLPPLQQDEDVVDQSLHDLLTKNRSSFFKKKNDSTICTTGRYRESFFASNHLTLELLLLSVRLVLVSSHPFEHI